MSLPNVYSKPQQTLNPPCDTQINERSQYADGFVVGAQVGLLAGRAVLDVEHAPTPEQCVFSFHNWFVESSNHSHFNGVSERALWQSFSEF
jgi:hypothetical protein